MIARCIRFEVFWEGLTQKFVGESVILPNDVVLSPDFYIKTPASFLWIRVACNPFWIRVDLVAEDVLLQYATNEHALFTDNSNGFQKLWRQNWVVVSGVRRPQLMLLLNKLNIPALDSLRFNLLLGFLMKEVPTYAYFDFNNSEELFQNVWFSSIYVFATLEPNKISVIIVLQDILIIFILSS